MNVNFKPFLPSIADIFFLTVFLTLSFPTGKMLLYDADTGYHIRTGEFILDTLSIPRHDIFSFISPPLPWTAHEWLSEVIMALIHKAFGLTGVVIFFSFAIASVYYLLFKIVQTYKGNIILATLLVLLVVVSSSLHWFARPHIFSWALMLVWYCLLDLYQYRDKNYLYLLPPIMLLWVNLHGGFMSGFILIGVYLLGNLIRFCIAQGTERQRCKNKLRLLGLTALACLLVSPINPYGYRILLFPFRLVSDKVIMDNVQEFLSPNFHGSMPFRYLLFLMIAILAISRSSLNVIELMLILLFTHMALYSARYIPLFAIIAAPILLKQAEIILQNLNGRFIEFFKQRSNNVALIDASTKGYLWPLASVAAVSIFAGSGVVEHKFDEKLKPVAAVEFLQRETLKGNMFNDDEFGDYIIYAAWPKYKVFFDGRSDMYGSSRIKEYLKITRLEPGWEKVIEKYNIKWVIYGAASGLSTFLMASKDWHLIYADKVANIFVKKIAENQAIISKYPDVKLVIEEDDSKEFK
jgi:hypothetical protein